MDSLKASHLATGQSFGTRHSCHVPTDWPGSGPIDLNVHDLPHHTFPLTECWHLNCHIHTSDDRKLALFASFFRVGKGPDELAGKVVHIHSLTWAGVYNVGFQAKFLGGGEYPQGAL